VKPKANVKEAAASEKNQPLRVLVPAAQIFLGGGFCFYREPSDELPQETHCSPGASSRKDYPFNT
jgi:hypothetical protein